MFSSGYSIGIEHMNSQRLRLPAQDLHITEPFNILAWVADGNIPDGDNWH